jgi:tetratricopeptide (TPR) repeat protein
MKSISLVTKLALLTNGLFLLYLIVFAAARQSALLYGAVATEVVACVLIALYGWWKRGTKKYKEEQRKLSDIESSFWQFREGRRVIEMGCAAVLSVVIAYMSIDFVALLLSATNHSKESESIYRVIAPPASAGQYPGFTLQLLAGATIEKGDLERARNMELTLLNLRSAVFGAESEAVAEMYSDLGDLEKRLGYSIKAEEYYKKAIALCRSLQLPRGFGSPMTKLGCLFRDEHRYREAEDCFRQAMDIRRERYGPHSNQFAETQIEYSRLLSIEGDSVGARDLEKVATQTIKDNVSFEEEYPWIPLVPLALIVGVPLVRSLLINAMSEAGRKKKRKRG